MRIPIDDADQKRGVHDEITTRQLLMGGHRYGRLRSLARSARR